MRRLAGVDAELPRWSPDGKRFVYVANLLDIESQDGAPDAYYSDRATINEINADGTGKHVLASSGYTGDVEWSPDGRWIAFDAGSAESERATSSLRVMRANGRGLRTVATRVDDSGLAWSPDGKRLAFSRSPAYGSAAIYIVTLASRRAVRVTGTGGERVTSVSWSPDGSQIALVAGWTSTAGDALEHGRAYVVDADGTNFHVVSKAGAFAKYNDFTSGAVWLPGRADQLLYNTDNGIYLASARAQRGRRLNTAESEPPVPSPDGTRFLFDPFNSSGKTAIYVQRIHGSAHRLTQAR